MFRALKTIIKRSPIAPLAAFVYGLALPPGRREIMLQGQRYDRQTFEVMRLGVEARDYTSFFDRLGHHARRWTGGSPRGLLLTKEEFVDNWYGGGNFYFIASPVLSP